MQIRKRHVVAMRVFVVHEFVRTDGEVARKNEAASSDHGLGHLRVAALVLDGRPGDPRPESKAETHREREREEQHERANGFLHGAKLPSGPCRTTASSSSTPTTRSGRTTAGSSACSTSGSSCSRWN